MKPYHIDKTVHVRDLLHLTTEEMIAEFNDVLTHKLQFDDGSVVTVMGRKTIVSSIYWRFHREFPELPLLPHHHIGIDVFGNREHRSIISAALWECFDSGICQDMDLLNRMAMFIFNDVFVYTGEELEEYVTTISVIDYLEIFEHPAVQRIITGVKPNSASIEKAYQAISKIVLECCTLNNNAIAAACRSSLIRVSQVLQAFIRGYLTDYDSNIFRVPLLNGFISGFKTLYETAVESRSGTKALKATTDPIRQTEYFGRKVALLNQVVKRVVAGNCGSTHTVVWQVQKKGLKHLDGKYHVLDNGELELITKDSTHLVGKRINLRSPTKCKHRHKYEVCETCGGELTKSIPSSMYYRRETRLGHICAIALCSFVTQKVMSTKHEDGSADAEYLNIPERDAKFIKLNREDDSKIQLADGLKGEKLKLVVQEHHIKNLNDINDASAPDVNILPTTTLATMSEVIIRRSVKRVDGTYEDVDSIINTSIGPRLASFTYEFLDYLKKFGWEIDSSGDYIMDLSKWKHTTPFLTMPQRHLNMLEYMKSISTFIEQDKKNCLSGCKTIDEALRKLYDIVNSRADVNIFHLEVLLLASLSTDSIRYDSRAPEVGEFDYDTFSIHRENIFNRSAGGAMAFERHGDFMTRPTSYTHNKPDHVMDPILAG